jgi:hypothetical protein
MFRYKSLDLLGCHVKRGDFAIRLSIRDIHYDVHITTLSFVEEFFYLSSEINFSCFVIHRSVCSF